jgi:hypothetical protein
MRLELSPRTFEKCSSVKFHENPSSGKRVAPCGRTDRRTDRQTDRHDEANSRFSLFCEKLLKTNHTILYREIIAVCSQIHTYLLTYLLTPWSRVLLEKLTGLQLDKKFPAF